MKKIVTKTELIEFIDAQPDARPVDMMESTSKGECGCLLVHLYKSIFGNEGRIGAGFNRVDNGICVDEDEKAKVVDIPCLYGCFNFIKTLEKANVKNYGELKPIAKDILEKVNE